MRALPAFPEPKSPGSSAAGEVAGGGVLVPATQSEFSLGGQMASAAFLIHQAGFT